MMTFFHPLFHNFGGMGWCGVVSPYQALHTRHEQGNKKRDVLRSALCLKQKAKLSL
jgi:hypothetical protein